jgi:hypothetical protein
MRYLLGVLLQDRRPYLENIPGFEDLSEGHQAEWKLSKNSCKVQKKGPSPRIKS